MTGEALRRAREAAGLTMTELARRAGVSVGAISRIESGHTAQPQIRTQEAIASALGLVEQEGARLFGRGGEVAFSLMTAAGPLTTLEDVSAYIALLEAELARLQLEALRGRAIAPTAAPAPGPAGDRPASRSTASVLVAGGTGAQQAALAEALGRDAARRVRFVPSGVEKARLAKAASGCAAAVVWVRFLGHAATEAIVRGQPAARVVRGGSGAMLEAIRRALGDLEQER